MTAEPFTPVASRRRSAFASRDLRPVVSFSVLLLLWIAARQFGWVDMRFLPAPHEVITRLVTELRTGTILADLGETLRRNLSGFVLGASAGLALGAILGTSRLIARIVGPTVVAQRQTALFAWVPLLAMWFGGGDAGKVAFIALAAFQPVVINTWRGLSGTPQEFRELASALRFTRLQYLARVALPEALPAIFTGLHAALIYAWLATVGSELFMNISPGLGGRLNEGSQMFELDLMFLAILLFGAIGLIYNALAESLEARLLKWNRT